MDMIGQLHSQIGDATLRSMVGAFYRRVKTDDLLGPMYPADDWEGAEKRLADFVVYRFGGAPTYIQERGHPRLRARHFSFAIGEAERDRWMKLMTEAMEEAKLPPEVAPLVREFFGQIADMMRNR